MLSFYSKPDLADGFGSVLNRSSPHKGLDFPHAAGTPIPAYMSGVVTVSEWSNALGNIVEIRGDDGRYVGYRHMADNSRVLKGTRLNVGGIVGEVGDTGSSAFGFHLCTTNSSAPRGVFGEGPVTDPWPFIQNPFGSSGSTFNPPDGELQKRIQSALTARGRYSGPVDGEWGPNTIRGIQTTIRSVGYVGPIDGIPGPETCKGVQEYAKIFGSYTGPIDRVLGPKSWEGFALGLERP